VGILQYSIITALGVLVCIHILRQPSPKKAAMDFFATASVELLAIVLPVLFILALIWLRGCSGKHP
jgi:hypothetical protein